jgi:hypothetical protein
MIYLIDCFLGLLFGALFGALIPIIGFTISEKLENRRRRSPEEFAAQLDDMMSRHTKHIALINRLSWEHIFRHAEEQAKLKAEAEAKH